MFEEVYMTEIDKQYRVYTRKDGVWIVILEKVFSGPGDLIFNPVTFICYF